MPLDKVANTVVSGLQRYKVLAIVGVFVAFFVVVGVLNYFQKATLEGFITLRQAQRQIENFTCKASHNTTTNTNEEE